MASTRRRRAILIWVGSALGLMALLVAAGLPLYVFPPAARIERADVIQVLGPALDDRIAMARQLVDEGYADHILVSIPPPDQPASDPDWCDDPRFTCEIPDPYTTDGETLLLEEYARAHGVRSAIVLTGTGHVSRARYIYATCYPGEATVVEVPSEKSLSWFLFTYAYQTGAFIKALITPCAEPPDR